MHLQLRHTLLSFTLLVGAGAAGACGSGHHPVAPHTEYNEPGPERSGSAPVLEVDVCEVTRAFSARVVAKETTPPPSVLVAQADEWFDLTSAYEIAKADLQRCVDPAMQATFATRTEVWEGMPPITATAKFDAKDPNSFSDDPAGDQWSGLDGSPLHEIKLDTVEVENGVELRLSAE